MALGGQARVADETKQQAYKEHVAALRDVDVSIYAALGMEAIGLIDTYQQTSGISDLITRPLPPTTDESIAFALTHNTSAYEDIDEGVDVIFLSDPILQALSNLQNPDKGNAIRARRSVVVLALLAIEASQANSAV